MSCTAARLPVHPLGKPRMRQRPVHPYFTKTSKEAISPLGDRVRTKSQPHCSAHTLHARLSWLKTSTKLPAATHIGLTPTASLGTVPWVPLDLTAGAREPMMLYNFQPVTRVVYKISFLMPLQAVTLFAYMFSSKSLFPPMPKSIGLLGKYGPFLQTFKTVRSSSFEALMRMLP